MLKGFCKGTEASSHSPREKTFLSAEDDVLPLHDGDPLGCEVAVCLEGEVPALLGSGDVAVGPGEAGVPVTGGDALHLEGVPGNLDRNKDVS